MEFGSCEKKITDKVKIRNVETKNRIAVPPMVCFHWSDDSGKVTERNVEHYEGMAKGGAGLIIGEATAVTKRARLHETELGLWEDGQTEGFRRLADVVHKYDTPFFVQLLHAGINGIDPEAETASDYVMQYEDGTIIHGHEMSVDRIEQTIDDFVKAAVRAQRAGLDGVELHGCHSYLFSQFMNRGINKRQDIYGVEPCKLAKDTAKAIKQVCGDAFVVGIRLGAFEPTLEDGIANAKALSQVMDFMDISYGFFPNMEPFKPEGYPYKEAIYGAGEIKKVLPDMPIFGVDSITDGEMAAGAIQLADLDMIDVGRGFLVNPDFGNCVLNGLPTGTCLHCQPACRWSPHLNNGKVNCPGRTLFQRTVLR